jgi:hypothetical protein
MSDFFLPNYNTSWKEKLFFPVCPVYAARHLEEASKTTSWRGRIVHSILYQIESQPFVLGMIVALAERCLAWIFAKQVSPTESGVNSDRIKKRQGEFKKGPNEPKKDAASNKVVQENDKNIDVVFEEEEIEDRPFYNKQIVNDKFVEEPERSDEIKKKDLKIDSTLFSEDCATPEEATYRILATPGFVADPTDPSDYSSQYVSKGLIQGSKALRFVTAKVTKKFPEAITPAALKEQRDVNLEQYLTLKIKRFGHAHSLEGHVPLPSGKKVNLEGFCEAFTVPMLASSFDEFAKKHPNLFSEEDRKWIVKHFNETTSSDFTEPDDIQVFACCIQDPHFVGPVALGTGYDWHATATIFWGPYLIFCNRGNGDNEPGIFVYHIPDRSKITEAVIWEMTKRQEVKGDESYGTQRIKYALGGVLLHYQPLTEQLGGHCTYESMEAALLAFMSIRRLITCGPEKDFKDFNDPSIWKEKFNELIVRFSKWWDFDRELVFQDMIAEIQEWRDKKNSFGKDNDLRKTYAQVLASWYQSRKERKKDQPLPPLLNSLLKNFGII